MWIVLVVFLVALAIWSGVLWFLLTIDIFDYSMSTIVGMHFLPPLIVVSFWIAIRYWRKQRLSDRQHKLERQRQATLDDERSKQKESFDKLLQQRRVAMEFRWAAFSDVIAHTSAAKYVEETEQARIYSAAHAKSDNWHSAPLLQMLKDLYMRVPMAGGLPIAFCGPSSQARGQLAQELRAMHAKAFNIAPMAPPATSIFDVFPLTIRGESIYAALLGLFTSRSDLPGIVVVAFDSMLQDCANKDDWGVFAEPEPLSEIEKWCGKPGRALIVQLITTPLLSAALEKMDSLPDNVALNAMTPHWDRQRIPAGMASWLAQWPKSQRDELLSLTPIAALHAPASTTLTDNLLSARCRHQATDAAAEAAINAAFFNPPFFMEGHSGSDRKAILPLAPIEIQNCGWMVHNAGDIAHCGDRLALLVYAISQHGIEMNPIEQANAVVPEFGHCGEAARWLSLTLAVQRAASLRKHVVLAEFNADVLSITFVVAPMA